MAAEQAGFPITGRTLLGTAPRHVVTRLVASIPSMG